MQVLSRTQSNDIFELARRVGLDPLDFDFGNKLDEDHKEAAVFYHRPTASRLSIRLAREHFWVTWWPKFGSGAPHDLVTSWDVARKCAIDWLLAVKNDHDAPDLWAEARKEHKLSDVAGVVGGDNKPFTPEEVGELEARLREIAAFIESREPLDAQQKEQVAGRFQYLLEAAKRGLGRIDWLNIFVGQMFQMVTEGLIKSNAYGVVMAHAWTLLKAGLRYLGS